MPKREHSAINSPTDDINGNHDDDADGTNSEKEVKVTENDVDVDVDDNQVDEGDDDAAADDELDDDEENVEGTEEEDDEEDREEEQEEEDEDEDEDSQQQQQQQSFVAWLEEGAAAVSIGEVHFSSGDYCTGSRLPDDVDDSTEHEHDKQENDNNNYCVVYEMVILPATITTTIPEEEEDEETEYASSSPILATFTNGNPFRILPVSACIGIQLEPVLMADKNNTTTTDSNTTDDNNDDANDDNDDSVIYTTYSMNAAMHRGLLEELRNNSISSSSSDENTDQKQLSSNATTPSVSILTKRNLCSDDEKVIAGVTAWWKAGEAKTGWDLQKIPSSDYTTRKTVSWTDDNSNVTNKNNNNNNTLLHLYRDLCAYQPLTSSDSRDTIEERFEWRTCLCVYFAWAVPTEPALQFLTQLRTPILEIGAGTGYWAMLLAKRGVDIVAYDMKESHNGHKHRFRHSIVHDGGVEQASKCSDLKEGDNNNNNNNNGHHGRALFLCWPDIVGDSASDDKDRGTFGVDCLQAYNGTMVIYIGELGPNVVRAKTKEGWGDPFPPGGSSASEAFQTELHQKWNMLERISLPNWPPYNSHLTVWVRN